MLRKGGQSHFTRILKRWTGNGLCCGHVYNGGVTSLLKQVQLGKNIDGQAVLAADT